MKWHNRDPVQRQTLPHQITHASVVSTSSHLKKNRDNMTATGALHLASENDWRRHSSTSKRTYKKPGAYYYSSAASNTALNPKAYADRGRHGSMKGAEAEVVEGTQDALQIQKKVSLWFVTSTR